MAFINDPRSIFAGVTSEGATAVLLYRVQRRITNTPARESVAGVSNWLNIGKLVLFELRRVEPVAVIERVLAPFA